MAQNQRYTESRHISLPLPYNREPGEPVLVGGFAGIALNGGKKGAQATVWLDGSYDVTVDGALTAGQPVYITDAGALTATAASNKPWGLSLASKSSGSGVVEAAPLGRTTGA